MHTPEFKSIILPQRFEKPGGCGLTGVVAPL
jgi:hypothetical protein